MLPLPNPQVIYRPLSEGAVLFATADEVYFGLNTVGARVWESLPPAHDTLEALCTALEREYPDVAPEVLRSDVLELLSELAAQKLVVART